MKSFLSCLIFVSLAGLAHAEKLQVFIGTGSTEARGIYTCIFDTEKGKLSTPELAAEIEQPGFLALSPDGKFLAANDTLISTVDTVPAIPRRIAVSGRRASIRTVTVSPGDARGGST